MQARLLLVRVPPFTSHCYGASSRVLVHAWGHASSVWSGASCHHLSSGKKWASSTSDRVEQEIVRAIPSRLGLFNRAFSYVGETKPAIISIDGTHTYKSLLVDSYHLAVKIVAALQSTDRKSTTVLKDIKSKTIAFLCPNTYSYVRTQWAIWRAGGIAVPLCNTHPAHEWEYYIEDSKSEVVIVHKSFEAQMAPVVQKLGIKAIVINDVETPSTTPSDSVENVDVEPSREALIIYTSGTTGKPKGVVTTHSNIEASISAMVEAWKWQRNDRILHVLPLHHVHGVVNALLCPLWSGATVEMLPKFDASTVWKRFIDSNLKGDKKDAINVFMAVPTVYQKLITEYDRHLNDKARQEATEACKRMRLMVSGSMALPLPLFQHWEAISGHRLLERYGMTEIGMALTNPYSPASNRLPGHVGTPFPGVEVRLQKIEDENEKEKTSDSIGELLVRGPQVFKEYFNRPEATQNAFIELKDGGRWFLTGDVVEAVQHDGHTIYKILGRRSVDILKSGGYKISALEVEHVLLSNPRIAECAVVGIEDFEWGQTLGAIVSLKKQGDTLSLDELRNWAKDKLAHYKIPRRLLLVHEIPRNAMGKINKKTLVKLFDSKQN